MAFTEASNDGALNGTTEVTVVPSPGASTRRLVRNVTIQNRDTAAVTLTLRYKDGASTRQLWKGSLAPGDTLIDETMRVLDATNKSIAAVLAGAPATTNPDFVATYADVT